jgi:hypothetical protein
MPATRVTIALNAKQSQKAPLLVPASALADPAATTSIRALVFKTTQSKLRLKKPSRVYVGGSGEELLSEDDWKRNIKDDVVLLISAGEDFVGVKRESGAHCKFLLGNLSTFALNSHTLGTFTNVDNSTSQPRLPCRSPYIECARRLSFYNATSNHCAYSTGNRTCCWTARFTSWQQIPHWRSNHFKRMDPSTFDWRRYRVWYGLVQDHTFKKSSGR